MKTTIIFLCIGLSAFAQSKKELKQEINLLKSQQDQLNLAYKIQEQQLNHTIDSLNQVIKNLNSEQVNNNSIESIKNNTNSQNQSATKTTPARIQDINKENLNIDKEAILHFKLIVDPNGNVTDAIPTQRCTTNDSTIITEVKTAILAQVKYEKTIGVEMRTVFYSIRIGNK